MVNLDREHDSTYIRVMSVLNSITDELVRMIRVLDVNVERARVKANTVQLYTAKTINATSTMNSLPLDKIMEYIAYQDGVLKSSMEEIQTYSDKISISNKLLEVVSDRIADLKSSGLFKPLDCSDAILHNGQLQKFCTLLPKEEFSVPLATVTKNLFVKLLIFKYTY